MAKLNREESLALARVIVRALNTLKGYAIDNARMSFPETADDRQFKQFSVSLKNKEQGLRQFCLGALVDSGISAELTQSELFEMK
jgi:hypothetical protein